MIQTAKKTQEEIKVLAINTLYEWAQKFFQYEKQHFAQFLGKNIFKVDGSIKAKYEHEKISHRGQLPDGTFIDVNYWFSSRYSFDMTVKICINGGSYDVKPSTAFCQYEQITLELFKIDEAGNLAESPNTAEYLNERYNLAELQKIAAEIKEAAKVYERAADKMPYLFKDVFFIQRLSR